MTPARIAALVEAARIWAVPLRGHEEPWPPRVQQLLDAVIALDALPAEPEPVAEGVEVAVLMAVDHGGRVHMAIPGTLAALFIGDWHPQYTTTLRIKREGER